MEANVPRPPGRIVTRSDYVHLKRLLREGGPALAGGFDVQRVLHDSMLLASSCVAPGVVTMGSQVFLVSDSDETPTHVTLVYPQSVNPARGRISVLSPLGSSLLGQSVGQTVNWRSFGRVHTARILSVLAKPAATQGVDA
jgi:regulator of nucleoside diphosphate kinase